MLSSSTATLFSFFLFTIGQTSAEETPDSVDQPSGWPDDFWSPVDIPYPVVGKVIDPNRNGQELTTRSSTEDPKETPHGEGKNSAPKEGVAEKQSYLQIKKALFNITKDSGDNVRMRCEVKGEPPPQIQWYKNEAPLEVERGRVDVRRYNPTEGAVGSRLRIVHVDIHDTGYYKCEATNGKQTVETTGILMVKAGRIHSPSVIPHFPPAFPHFPALGGRLPDTETDSEYGFCQVYRGITCSQLIGNRTVYVKATLSLNQVEERLAAALTVLATSHDIAGECHKHAIPFLCFSAFPPCDDSRPYPVARDVCRDECESLNSAICREEFDNARRHPLLNQQTQLLPVCGDLPPVGSKEGENCFSLGIPRVVQVDKDQFCYENRGEGYRGPISHTISSFQCQRWTPAPEYPELAGGHNYCRNPGGLEAQPWCFTTDPNTRKEVCDIPKCVHYLWLYILLPIVISILLLALALGVWCSRQRKKTCVPPPKIPHGASQLILARPDNHNIEMKLVPCNHPQVPEVSPSAIQFLQELGEGSFGKLYRGEVQIKGVGTPVAIKTLKESPTVQNRQEFYREVERLSDFHHPNVVCLVGVCLRGKPLCMLFEYMFRCDLHEYLIVHSPHSDVSIQREDGTPQVLDTQDFLAICKQIAAGMEYLAGRRIIHRDMAARNCLVDDKLTTIKISNFGQWRHSCSSDYCRIRNMLLPVRWMAPESLLYGKFSTQSDVWSLGVVIWEVFSYGLQPYYNYDSHEVVDMICSRKLLPRPEDCPSYIYSLMMDCWQETSTRRPTFKEIHSRLASAQTLHDRTFSMSRSVITHNSSHHSSTGPSNNTGSTNLSNTPTAAPCAANSKISPFPKGISTTPATSSAIFLTSQKIPPIYRAHQCEQV